LFLRLRSLALYFQRSCLISAKLNRGYYVYKLVRRPKVTVFKAHQANYMTADKFGQGPHELPPMQIPQALMWENVLFILCIWKFMVKLHHQPAFLCSFFLVLF
jgi:hypothetical protein